MLEIDRWVMARFALVAEKIISAYELKHSETERCRNEAMRESSDRQRAVQNKQQDAFQQKVMSDPALQQKMAAMAQQMGMAQAKGDTATLYKLQREMYAAAGFSEGDPKADTLAADKACGAMPTKPAVLVQIDRLSADENGIRERIRATEERAGAAAVKESGLSARQYDVAKERVEMYLERAKAQSRQRGFSKAELEALGARSAELEAALQPQS